MLFSTTEKLENLKRGKNVERSNYGVQKSFVFEQKVWVVVNISGAFKNILLFWSNLTLKETFSFFGHKKQNHVLNKQL
jgi:hypothetical protein